MTCIFSGCACIRTLWQTSWFSEIEGCKCNTER